MRIFKKIIIVCLLVYILFLGLKRCLEPLEYESYPLDHRSFVKVLKEPEHRDLSNIIIDISNTYNDPNVDVTENLETNALKYNKIYNQKYYKDSEMQMDFKYFNNATNIDLFRYFNNREGLQNKDNPIKIQDTYNKMIDPNDDPIKKSGLFTSKFFESNLTNDQGKPDLPKISKDFQYFNNATAIMTGNHYK